MFAAEAEIRPQPKSLEAAPHEVLTAFLAFNSFRANQIAIHTEIGSLRTLFIWGASYDILSYLGRFKWVINARGTVCIILRAFIYKDNLKQINSTPFSSYDCPSRSLWRSKPILRLLPMIWDEASVLLTMSILNRLP